jgi:hypothetical protein
MHTLQTIYYDTYFLPASDRMDMALSSDDSKQYESDIVAVGCSLKFEVAEDIHLHLPINDVAKLLNC